MATEFVVRARWVVPVEPAGTVLSDHAVVVREGKIEALLPAAEAAAQFASFETIELENHVLIPGLVNAHTHAAMTLMRGMADDVPLMRWLEEHIWPVERSHVSAAMVRDGTQLACAEMLLGGVTSFSDMYFFPEAALEAARAWGMRSQHGMVVIEMPTAYASDPEDYLRKGLELRDRNRADSLASFSLAPQAPYTVSDPTFRRIAVLAGELDVPIHLHLHETTDEIERSLAEHGVRPLERLARLNLLGPNFTAVHGVHLQREEIELLARHGCSVVHCPSSNLKLASGFAPVQEMLHAGVNVALGTDGAASNNRLDMFQEMRTAALLAKAVAKDARAMPAHAALRAATLAGARALGIDRVTGSLLPGKAADLAAVEMRSPFLVPCYDPVSHLAYAAARDDVSHVWVGGKALVAGRKLQNAELDALDTRIHLWQNALARAGS